MLKMSWAYCYSNFLIAIFFLPLSLSAMEVSREKPLGYDQKIQKYLTDKIEPTGEATFFDSGDDQSPVPVRV